MVTGFGDEDVREIARAVGVNAFLTKPVDRVQLSACILSISGGRVAMQKSTHEPQLRKFDAIDTAELAIILAERDRMRALSHDGQPSPELRAEAPVGVTGPTSRPSEEILILDNQRRCIAMLDYHVRKLSSVPARFTHPQQALEWCKTHEPCLVIVDYMMPDVNGLEFTRHFRSLPGKADTPVLMISACTDLTVKQAAHDPGVNEFLHKPLDPADLTAHLRAILAARARESEKQSTSDCVRRVATRAWRRSKKNDTVSTAYELRSAASYS